MSSIPVCDRGSLVESTGGRVESLEPLSRLRVSYRTRCTRTCRTYRTLSHQNPRWVSILKYAWWIRRRRSQDSTHSTLPSESSLSLSCIRLIIARENAMADIVMHRQRTSRMLGQLSQQEQWPASFNASAACGWA